MARQKYASPVDDIKVSTKHFPHLTEESVRAACSQTVLDRNLAETKTVERQQFTMSLNPAEHLFKKIITLKEVPTVNELITTYIEDHRENLTKKYLDGYKKKMYKMSKVDWFRGLRARMYRTFIGMLTQLHAQIYLEKYLSGIEIYSTLGLDRAGIDWIILNGITKYGCKVRVLTVRAEGFFMSKLSVSVNSPDVVPVSFPYALEEGSKYFGERLPNGFVVISNNHVKMIQDILEGRTEPIQLYVAGMGILSHSSGKRSLSRRVAA
jgi:hypothetical protein